MLRPRVHITYDVLRTLHADVPTFSAHHSLLTTHCSKAQRHEFRPSVVAMAERILITVWMISFQVSLFFIGSLFKGFVFSLFYFGCWLLAVGSSCCHAELVSASVRGEGLVKARGEMLKQS